MKKEGHGDKGDKSDYGSAPDPLLGSVDRHCDYAGEVRGPRIDL